MILQFQLIKGKYKLETCVLSVYVNSSTGIPYTRIAYCKNTESYGIYSQYIFACKRSTRIANINPV